MPGRRNSLAGGEEKFPEGSIHRGEEKFPAQMGGYFSSHLGREFLLPSMNFSSPPAREFLLPSGQGISPPLRAGNLSFREFIIQAISPSVNFSFPLLIYPPSGSGNFSFREFPSPSGRGFLIQGIYPPLRVGNFSFREFVPTFMNFSFREFILPSMNLSSLRVREFIIHLGQGISPPSGASRGFLIPPGPPGYFSSLQGRRGFLLHPGEAGDFSSLRGLQGRRGFLLPSMNFSSLRGLQGRRGFLLPSMNFSFGEFIIPFYEFLIQGISPSIY